MPLFSVVQAVTASGLVLISVMTNESLEEMALAVGSELIALFSELTTGLKAPRVSLATNKP
ncbi:Uncharacterised protein [Yersinia intermedia]|uniref:hypothetical protein n=1 Tax=Yersinia intermedia TaxID=631 RepID=UPI0005E2758D|nr:hypothetical protein [Yersinia intermedia]CNI67528.1 Uncharacterised protein [Yersinia intermedia]